MKKKDLIIESVIQLEIDFLIPYELSPTLDDIKYEISLTGTFNAPCSVVIAKKRCSLK